LGKEAITHVKPIERLGKYTVVECRLETGRTHQIRIHLSEAGHPLCGDKVYRGKFPGTPIPDDSGAPRVALHAAELGFEHPITGEYIHHEMALPRDLVELIDRMRGGRRAPPPRPTTSGRRLATPRTAEVELEDEEEIVAEDRPGPPSGRGGPRSGKGPRAGKRPGNRPQPAPRPPETGSTESDESLEGESRSRRPSGGHLRGGKFPGRKFPQGAPRPGKPFRREPFQGQSTSGEERAEGERLGRGRPGMGADRPGEKGPGTGGARGARPGGNKRPGGTAGRPPLSGPGGKQKRRRPRPPRD